MPDIKPFRGIFYNPEFVPLARVLAPPYDVISPQQQTALYDADPHNVVRLILGREEDPYGSAAGYLREWMEKGILSIDDVPAFYLLAQTFRVAGSQSVTRRGIVAACRLEDLGKGSILPHEKTLSAPKEDRLRLFQATHAMFSQIFGLYSDPHHELDEHFSQCSTPSAAVDVTFEGVQNRLWRVRDGQRVSAIADFLRDKPILIADGHHRYETALLYRDSFRFKSPLHTGEEPYNFVPMFLTNMHDPGLVILPTHRLIYGIPDFDPLKLKLGLKNYFKLTDCDDAEQMMTLLRNHEQHAYGLVLRGRDPYHVMSIEDERYVAHEPSVPESVSSLDVSVLHTLVVKQILNISDEQQETKMFLEYDQDGARAIRAVREGKAQAVFLMNPTRIEQVRAVASAGMVMPQKSTFFYPKLLSGLVMYSFGELKNR